MPKIETFTATLNQEGSTGSTRGKIPATLINRMGGKAGDVIEFNLNGSTLVGGRIITGKEARQLRASRQNFGTAEKAPVKANGHKVVAKQAPVAIKAKTASKPSATVAKSSKNKTSVAVSKGKAQAKGQKVKPRFSI